MSTSSASKPIPIEFIPESRMANQDGTYTTVHQHYIQKGHPDLVLDEKDVIIHVGEDNHLVAEVPTPNLEEERKIWPH